MPIPAALKRYSGYNYSNINPHVDFIYDASIDAFRPLTASDLATNITDLASGYNSGGLSFMNVGGRAVELSGWNPNYSSGSGALMNFNRENGGLLVQQADLSKDIDSVTNYPVGASFVNSTSPSGMNGTAISGSPNLIMWGVQNLQTGRLWVKFGNNAHSTSFNMVLKGATSSGAADGGTYVDYEGKWRGNVAVSGEFNVLYNAWGIYT